MRWMELLESCNITSSFNQADCRSTLGSYKYRTKYNTSVMVLFVLLIPDSEINRFGNEINKHCHICYSHFALLDHLHKRSIYLEAFIIYYLFFVRKGKYFLWTISPYINNILSYYIYGHIRKKTIGEKQFIFSSSMLKATEYKNDIIYKDP